MERRISGFLAGMGRASMDFLSDVGQLALFTVSIHRWIFRKPFDREQLFRQMVRVGVETIPVALLTAFFTGMILALQSGSALESILKGISKYVGTIVSLAMVRELGPLLTALIVSGRVGSSVAAEIGTMKVTEQVDALYTLAANPVQYLVVPRYLAFAVMLPILTVFADLTGWLGGLLVSVVRLSSNSTVYIDATRTAVLPGDILGGLLKSVFFGAIIAVVSCYEGFKTEGGAEGVGRSTTNAVVVAFMLVLASDYFLTALLTIFGL